MYHYKQKNSSGTLIWITIAVIIMAAGVAVYLSDIFEREAPSAVVEDKIYWNLKEPIKIKLTDNIGIKSYKVTLIKEDAAITLAKGNGDKENLINLEVKFPAKTFYPKGKTKLRIELVDTSLWNFFSGNRTIKESEIIIDRKKPIVNLISKTYGITLGGAAVVILEVRDENLQDLKIVTNSNKEFKMTPFYKEGFYISLVGRDIRDKYFKIYAEATDKAGNVRRKKLPFYNKYRNYRSSKIALKKRFLDGKIEELFLENFDVLDMEHDTPINKFVSVNELLRKRNSNIIRDFTTKTTENQINDFKIRTFEPLKNYKAVASFGDHRYFYLNKSKVSESYHLGLDIASTKNAHVFSSNPGKIVFAGSNGIYGNNVIIHHGLGLYSIYGHCSEIDVEVGDDLENDFIIAKTGKTGLALGDHLHFELRIQGVPVRPAEWMDKKWMKENIFKPIKKAKELIDDREI